MNETYLEADEGVSYTQAMVEEQETFENNSHKIVLINTQWTDFVYNKDGFHIHHGDVTDEQNLSRTFEGLQLEAGEGAMTPTYMDHQYETDMSMTSDAFSWRSHSPGVLVEGIGRWVDEMQLSESLVFSPLTLTPVWQMPASARLTLVADQGELTTEYPELMDEDFVFEP
jgi:hypothetical protein